MDAQEVIMVSHLIGLREKCWCMPVDPLCFKSEKFFAFTL